MGKSFIEVPSGEVRRRTAEYLEWYNGGGKEQLRAEREAEVRKEARDGRSKETKGFFWWKRPYTDAELDRYVETYMHGTGDFCLHGDGLVKMYIFARDRDADEISALHNTATGDLPMYVNQRIWGWIKAHSSEPVNA